MPKVSIVIRSYNEEQHIGRLLHGIEMQDHDDVEVILVDSGSTDSTVPIAEKYGVRIVHIPKADFSFGRALNRGCAVAEGDILLFASAHVYPLRRDWVSRIVAPFEDPAVALSYGRQVGNEITKFSEQELFKAWFPSVSTSRQAHNFCNNANCAIRRSGWEAQPYDEVLTGLEDLDWAKKARQKGGQIAYVAEAVIAHVHEETWPRVRNRYRREALALRSIEPGIKFTFADFVGLTFKNILSDMRSAYRSGGLGREAMDIMFFRTNQFWGTWAGHRQSGEIDAALRNRFYYPAEEDHGITPPLSSDDIDYRTPRGHGHDSRA